MKAIFITYSDIDDLTSGSGVRPHNMYHAFLELGIETYLLEGQQNRRDERKEKVRNFMHEIDGRKFDFCYIEYPSGPIFNKIDIDLIKNIHAANIPIGLFYRDMYWLFPDWAWAGMNFLKKNLLIYMQKRDLKVIEKCCDIVYFPSEGAGKAVAAVSHLNKTGVLPPGCKHPEGQVKQKVNDSVLYIGGLREADGVDLLFDAIEEINEKDGKELHLDVIARETEFKYLNDRSLLNKPYIQFNSASGEALEKYFARNDLGIIPRRHHFYMDLAIGVKSGDYISHDLPVITTDGKATADYIRSEKCGIVCPATKDGIKSAILEAYKNDNLSRLRNETYMAAERNLWSRRVEKLISDLVD